MESSKNIVKVQTKNDIYFCHRISVYNKNDQTVQRTYTQIHTACEIFIMLSGKISYIIEGKQYDVSPNEIVIIPPFTTHYTLVDKRKDYDRMVIEFSPQLIPNLVDLNLTGFFTAAKNYSYIIPQEYAEKEKIKEWFTEFEKSTRKTGKYKELDLTIKILTLVKKLNILTSLMTANPKTLSKVKEKSISHIIIDYINKNIEEVISIKKMSEDLNISQSHILHSFKNEIGDNLHKYINLQKMDIAKKQIKLGIAPTIVASNLGFEYYSTFYNNFIKQWGITPKEMANKVATIEKNTNDITASTAKTVSGSD